MTVFEVLVERKNLFEKTYTVPNGWISPQEYDMKHIERRTAKQAGIEGSKYGHVRSVRKVNVEKIRGSIEYLDINKGNPPKPPPDILHKQTRYNPIAMDEMIVPVRKSVECVMDERITVKVQKRRDSMMKEKQKIFPE
jgi:hypothetical protein